VSGSIRRCAPALVLLCSLFAPVSISAQAPRAPGERIDVSKLGPQVGERVPDFSLKDQNGRTQTLRSIMGPRGAMLVFQRSADW
jgi:hypothetical protein